MELRGKGKEGQEGQVKGGGEKEEGKEKGRLDFDFPFRKGETKKKVVGINRKQMAKW